MDIQKENHLLEQFEKTKTFKRFFSTLLRFDEELDCFISTEKWRDKEAELLTAAWWMFAEVANPQAVPEGFVLVDKHQLAQLMANMDSFGKKALGDDYVSFADIAAVLDEAQEPAND